MGQTAVLAVRIISDAKGAHAGLDQTSTKMGLLGRAGGIAKVGLAAAATAVIAFVGTALGQAANLEQSVGAVDTVFGRNSAQMHKWAKSAAVDVGLAKNEFNELGTLIGTQLANGGTAMKDLAPKTKKLITLGADLSSMFGGSTKDAVSALSSALKGERDPIERYGVSLNQAKIDAKAAELGFRKVAGSLSTEASQAATLALIMDQTSKAHGNFGRETGTVAHQQQVAAAQWENFTANMGTLFLPVAVKVMSFINTTAMPILDSFAASAKTVADLVSGKLTAGWAALTAPTGRAATAITGVQTALAGLGRWAGSDLLPALTKLGDETAAAFAVAAPVIGGIIDQLTTGMAPAMPVIGDIFTTIGGIITGVLAMIGAAITLGVNTWSAIWTQWGPQILGVVMAVWNGILGVIQPALHIIQSIIATVTAAIRGDWSGVWAGLAGIITGTWNLIIGVIRGAWNIITSVFSLAWSVVIDLVSAGVATVVGWFTGLGAGIRSTLAGAGTWLVSAGRNVVEGLWAGISSGYEWIKAKITSWVGNVVDFFKRAFGINSPATVMIPLGVQLPAGVGVGMDRNIGAVLGPTRRLARAITSAFSPELAAPTLSAPSLSARRAATQTVNQITINGALDARAVAEQLRDVLNGEARLSGRVATINGAIL